MHAEDFIPKHHLNIAVIGVGAFGTAMALTAYRAGHNVTCITKDAEQVREIQSHHTNSFYFKDYTLPSDLCATTDVSVLKDQDAVIIAVPSQYFEDLLSEIKGHLPPHIPVLLTIKGLVFPKKTEDTMPTFPRALFQSVYPNPVGLISGPNFAVELVHNLPAATNLATKDHRMSDLLNHACFRVYPTQDFVGVEVSGVVKNILALGCGMIAGASLGHNALFAFLTRGLYEMMALGKALGADMSTFVGLSGVGDLALTCSSTKSRNFSFGARIGRGETSDHIQSSDHGLCEGYHSVQPLLALARHHHVDMPLCQAVFDVLQGTPISDAVYRLFARPAPRL